MRGPLRSGAPDNPNGRLFQIVRRLDIEQCLTVSVLVQHSKLVRPAHTEVGVEIVILRTMN